jgi:hypothetical protein
VCLGAEPGELLLDFRSLAFDVFQAALVFLHLLLVGRGALGESRP